MTKKIDLPLGGTSQQNQADYQQAVQTVTDKNQNYAAEVYATKRPTKSI
jgi:hypothetical protein